VQFCACRKPTKIIWRIGARRLQEKGNQSNLL
jgi:hypothetical protein